MEFKKLSAVDSVVEPIDTAQVLIEEDGVIKKTPKNAVGAQADWAEIDETSPAFIKNKPVEEPEVYDLDITVTLNAVYADSDPDITYDVHHISSYDEVLEKISNGEALKIKAAFNTLEVDNQTDSTIYPMLACSVDTAGAEYAQNYGEIVFACYSFQRFGLMVIMTANGEVFFEARMMD